MDLQQAKKNWHDWQKSKNNQGEFTLASDIAANFISAFPKREQGNLGFIDLLCEIAMGKHAMEARRATSALFGEIIEILCDDFSQEGVVFCNRVLLRILEVIRKTTEGRELDSLLKEKGLHTTKQLLHRYEKLIDKTPIPEKQKANIKKIIILSRVTAGADIAINGIFITRLRISFPQAELVLIGPGHLPEMFDQTENCRFVRFIYKNDGTLIEKMTTWPTLLSLVNEEHKNCKPEEVLLFDPDTRLSQLGLLPLTIDASTYYFCARAKGFSDIRQKNLSQIANQWLNHILGENKEITAYPLFVNLEQHYLELRSNLKKPDSTFIITINFGVGNDPKKKINPLFELNLLLELLKEPKTVIILDSGCGSEEQQRAKQHISTLQELGFEKQTISRGENIKNISMNHGIISHKGPLGDLGKLIKISDCFIGYDSCGQHIASAAQTPSVIIFAGAPTARFVARWSPDSKAGTTIPIYRHSKLGKRELDSLLKNVLEAVTLVRKKKD